MFIGHLALAFAAKPLVPRVSLGWPMAATLFIDLLWPIFLLAGWEHVEIAPGNTAFTPLAFTDYPITHSLVGAAGWALLAALAFGVWKKDWRGAWVIGLLVLSHWFLDAISHRPDLPLWPGDSPLIGLGLWNSIPRTLMVEGLMFAVGVVLYLRATLPGDRSGLYPFLGWLALVLVSYAAASFGPLPPDAHTLALSALAVYLLPPWAAWFDRHRVPAERPLAR